MTDAAVVALFYFSIRVLIKNHNQSTDGRTTKELIAYMLPALLGSLVFVAVGLIILYGFRIQEEIMNLQEERTQKSVLENQISQMQNSMSGSA